MSGYYNRNNRGITKKLGPVTAYADAVLAGYTGTREQWAQDMAKLGQNVTQVAQNTKLTTELAEQTRVNTEQVEKDTADVRRLADETSDNAAQVASNTAESNRLAEETKQAAAQAKEDAEYAGAAADNFRVDTTLSEAGKAAEAKTTGEKFAQLSEEIDGLDTLIDNHLVKKIRSVNLMSSYEFTKQILRSTGEIDDSTNYVLTDYLECESDRTLSLTRIVGGSYGAYVRGKSNVYAVGFYNKNKELISVAGGTPTVITDKDFVSPLDTKYIRVCFEQAYVSTSQPMLEYSDDGISEVFVEYFEPYYVYNENIDNADVIGMFSEQIKSVRRQTSENAEKIDTYLVKKIRSVNLLSSYDFDSQAIDASGTIKDSKIYVLTDYVECESGRTLSLTRIVSGSYGNYTRGKSNVYSIAFYDENKNLISIAGGAATVITEVDFITPADTAYVRVSFEKTYAETYQPMLEYSEDGISETFVEYFEPYYVYNKNIDNEVVIAELQKAKQQLESEVRSFTTRFPVPQKPDFVKRSGQYNGCLSDIRTVDGVDVLYGFSGASVVRSAHGADCGSPNILMTMPSSGGTINFVKKLDDGTLLAGVENAGGTGYAKLYKGTAEIWNASTTKFDVTWTEVMSLQTSGNYFSMWFGLSIYKNIIVVGEYGAHNVARNVYISRDYGNTWAKIFTAEVDNSGAGVHIHDVCYDPYSDVIWICTGDGYWAQNVYFSYDNGKTWNKNYGVKESPSQFTQILPLPNCVLFTSDNTKHMAVYRCNRQEVHERKTHLDLELAYTFYDDYNAESPIGTNGCVVYGKDACAYFGWAERYDVAKTKSPVIGTKDGYNFYVVWENETITVTTSSYNGIFGVYGVSDNGNIAISYVNKEDGTTGKHSIVMQAPTWKSWETMFD